MHWFERQPLEDRAMLIAMYCHDLPKPEPAPNAIDILRKHVKGGQFR